MNLSISNESQHIKIISVENINPPLNNKLALLNYLLCKTSYLVSFAPIRNRETGQSIEQASVNQASVNQASINRAFQLKAGVY